ncbi:MAG: choice-of-anchor Q domain-containing protein [Pirellulales bacterium]
MRDNAAVDDGGAIANGVGRVTIQDSSLIANSAGDDGGGIFNASDMGGQHNLTIRNSTLTGNTAAGWGGAVFNFSGIASIEFSTIARNTSTSGTAGGVGSWGDTNTTRTDVRSSIIAGNSGSDVDHVTGVPGPANSFNSLKYNLIGLGTSLAKFNQVGDQTGVADPRLGPLGDYGGSTQTLPLLFNSPALDAGDPLAFAGFGGVPNEDQRGFFRVADGNGDATARIDIGAFESDARYLQVDTTIDENDGDYSPGDLSLREAISLSNLFATVDVIFFRPDLSGQTITLHQGELTINDSATVDASALAARITIDASGNDITPGVEDGNGSRVLVLQDDGIYFNQITLRKLTLTGADGNGSGGAIFNNDVTTVEDCTITGNSSQWGAGVYNTAAGSLVVARSTISGNSAISPIPEAIGSGGGLYNWGGNLQVLDSVVTGNDSVSDAGGIQNVNGGYLTVARSTVSGNSALHFGGGIRNGDGYVRIESSTISGNSAQKGGGIHVDTPNFRYTMILNSTVSGNVAPLGGGGLSNDSGKVRFQFSTVTENVSNDFAGSGVLAAPSPGDSPVSFYHTIVADNFDPNGPRPAGALDIGVSGPTNSLISQGYNLIGTGSFVAETFVENGDQIIGTADPGLGPLADNGGETKTHALLAGSPAIDAGSPSVFAGGEGGGPLYDQRGPGFDRIRDGNGIEIAVIDIGAFEVQQFTNVPALPGDYNHDDIVDAADYTVWRDTLNQSVDAYSGADGDGDGTVDQDDYGVWKLHFGQSLPGSGAQVEALLAAGGGSVDGSILVTTLDDTTDFSDGLTSLREAIFAANIVGGPNVIEFAESLTAAGRATILLTQGELKILDAVSILGPGAALLAIDASSNDPDMEHEVLGNGSRIFNVDDGNALQFSDVTIRGLTLTGGDSELGGAIRSVEALRAEELVVADNWAAIGGAIALIGSGAESVVADCIINGNQAGSQGGAIWTQASPGGTVSVRGNTIFDNEANRGGALYIGAGPIDGRVIISSNTITANLAKQQGGAIFITPQSPIVTIRDSSISGNTSAQQGGGISANGARNLSIINSFILDNRSTSTNSQTGRGGGIYSNTGDLAIAGSTISGNRALIGGGIYGRNGELSVQFSTLSENTATAGNGGGIYSNRDRLTLLGSSITGNEALGPTAAMGRGGGVWHAPNFAATSTIADNVIGENSAQMYGGGLYFRPTQETAASALLAVTNLTITGNKATRGGGIAAGFGTQGANLGTLIVNGGSIQDNTASSTGGGIYMRIGNLTVNGTTIAGNSAGNNGGGVAGPTVAGQNIQMTFDGATLRDNRAANTGDIGDGGGIWLSSGGSASVLSLTRTQVVGNTARRGGGIYRNGASSQSSMLIASSVVSGNIGTGAGGGLYNLGGLVAIANSTFESNRVTGNVRTSGGGAIFNRQADLLVTNTTISGNTAMQSLGGGIYHSGGDLSVMGSTIAGNSTMQAGAGVWANSSISDRISFHSTTVSGNLSSQATGGLWLQGDVTLRHSTIVLNRTLNSSNFAAGVQFSGPLELDHVIIAQNLSSNGNELDLSNPGLTFASIRSSLIGSNASTSLVAAPVGSPDADGNLIGAADGGVIDPLLAPLFTNGGPTKTHSLLPGSPAIDGGALVSGTPLGFDQRGNPFSRMVDGDGDGVIRIDMGAYESQGIPQFTSGDFNRDGVVDACDYLIWRDTLGVTVEPYHGADGDGDGLVGESDFDIWKAHFGRGLSFTSGGSGAFTAATAGSEPDNGATIESIPQPLAPPGVIQTAPPRQSVRRARLTSASTDQVLAWWSARHRIVATHDAATPVDSHGECDDTHDEVTTLDLAFEALAG